MLPKEIIIKLSLGFLFVVSACAQSTPVEETVVGCQIALNPIPELLPYVSKAATRWNKTTGCDFVVSETGIPVRFGTDDEMAGGEKLLARGVTHLNEEGKVEYVAYRSGPILPWTIDMTLTHELGHVLGCLNHTSDGEVMDSAAQLYSKIGPDSLECVCAVANCVFMQTENGKNP